MYRLSTGKSFFAAKPMAASVFDHLAHDCFLNLRVVCYRYANSSSNAYVNVAYVENVVEKSHITVAGELPCFEMFCSSIFKLLYFETLGHPVYQL